VQIINNNKCTFAGVVVALDRQEKGAGDVSAIQQVETDYGVKVVSIVSLGDVLEYLVEIGGYDEVVKSIHEYRKAYGTSV
jgi:orotate phosphoribosyltransferase